MIRKILIHSYLIIDSSLLPSGQMLEEAQKFCNKFIEQKYGRYLPKTFCSLRSCHFNFSKFKETKIVFTPVELLCPPSINISLSRISSLGASDLLNPNVFL